MNFDPEHYSKYTLRRFVSLLDVICWVAIVVVASGIVLIVKWWTA